MSNNPWYPDDRLWIEWGGGECPVAPETYVEFICPLHRDMKIGSIPPMIAGGLDWRHINTDSDIVAYLVVEEPAESRS